MKMWFLFCPQDVEFQATVHVPRVVPKNEDPSLVDGTKECWDGCWGL